jgi:dUTP pyrophosphatase
MSFYVKLLNPNGRIPRRANVLDAGFDLSSDTKYILHPKTRAMISTGISIQVPEGTYGRVAPRSGLAAKFGIDVLAGVIDRSYTGEVKVILYNTSDEDFVISIGDRIAQLILEKIESVEPIIVNELPALESNTRQEGGFGSSGI